MRIGIIGTGAVGGTIAALFDRAGHEVQATARGATLAAIRENGLRLDGAWGEHTARVNVAETLDATPDLAFVTTKAQDAPAALAAHATLLAGIPVVVVQNGLEGLEAARAALPHSRIVGALALYAAQNVGGGRVTVTAPGVTVMTDDALAVPALGAVMPVAVTHDFTGAQWSKLVINMVNGTPAATGLSVQETVEHPVLGRIVTALLREAARTGLATGVHFAPLQGLTHPLVRLLAVAPLVIGHAVPAAMARRMGAVPNLGSTLQSLRRGQLTEIDYLNGAVVREASVLGREAPVNAALVAAVHEVERTGRFFSAAELARRTGFSRSR